jgi:hypothetical protein
MLIPAAAVVEPASIFSEIRWLGGVEERRSREYAAWVKTNFTSHTNSKSEMVFYTRNYVYVNVRFVHFIAIAVKIAKLI